MYDYAVEKKCYYEALKGILDIIRQCPECDVPGELPLPCAECPWQIKSAGCLHAIIHKQIADTKELVL